MEKIALLFPGQGSQFTGMAKTLCEQNDIARKTLEEAGDVLGFDLAALCFDGSPVEISKAANMFPALLAVGVASFRVYMKEVGVIPQFCAGHSLGEYSALTCAGVMKYSDALKIVRLRGQITQEIADSEIGAMTIIDLIESGIVEEECAKASCDGEIVKISCYNSPNQVAVCGHTNAVQRLEDRILDMNGQITPIIGGAPYHCQLMKEAAEKLKLELNRYKYGSFRYPVISNVTSQPYRSSSDIPEILSKQLTLPVRWQDTMKLLERYGITLAVEMGPKNLLCNLVKANTSEIRAVCIGIGEDRMNLIGELVKKDKPTVITKCLAAAVCTPNANFDSEEYQKGAVEPYRKLEQIQSDINESGKEPQHEQMIQSLEILKTIFTAKKLPIEEQDEWFSQIIEETGTNYEIRNKCGEIKI